MIGETIGNYRIVSKLGQGGMGTVYLAEDTQLGRKVAIKLLNPGLMAQGGQELERFRSEAKVQANLSNPNVVTLHDFIPYGDSFYMVMEFVDGKSLADLVRTAGALPPHIVVAISKQILEGLAAAHRLGVVHRDLKPSNVLITPDGIAKVMDFGIAKVQGGKNLTATGALVGTVYYMSPEQVRGEAVDARSDIYSFGIILFEILTGRVPFKDESDFKIMVHHVQTPPPPPTQLLPEIPGDIEEIVMLCLKKAPEERFQSADAILAALDSFEEQERAAGRGQMYTRRALAQWVAGASGGQAAETPASVAPAPLSSSARMTSQQVPTALPAFNTSSTAGMPAQPRDYTISPPIPAELRAELARQGTPAPAKKGLMLLLVLCALVLIGGGGGYWYLTHRGAVPGVAMDSQAPATQAGAGVLPGTQPAAATAQPATDPGAAQTVPTTAAVADLSAQTSSPGASPMSASGTPASAGQSMPLNASAPPPTRPAEAMPSQKSGNSQAFPGEKAADSAAPGGREPKAVVPVPAVPARRAATEPPAVSEPTPAAARPARQPEAARLPRSILIFFDQDPSSERLPLSSAQAQVADIVRQAGYQVVSTGTIAPGIRAALDKGDLATVRGHGVGFVILATASGSLERQSAYGSVYNVAKVNVNLELVRMSDGGVAARASGDSRSRGSANASSAISEALMTATSDGARELMRQFQP
jgi:eukaryotic-like serine/threonine-protein kinase